VLPFTHEEFLAVFATYNRAVWPAQVGAYALGLGVAFAVTRGTRRAAALAAAGLAAMWLWTGVVYHALHFARINPSGSLFGTLFVAQAALLLLAARRRQLAFASNRHWRAWLGWAFVVYAMVFYPLLGMLLGPGYPWLPMFGITPCPLTLFTLGILLIANGPVPAWLLGIPLLWSIVGGSAAFLLGVAQDWLLLFSALAVIPIRLHAPDPAGRAA
jgi:hypothetical protein